MNHVEELRQHTPVIDNLSADLGILERASDAAMSMSVGEDDDDLDNHQKTISMWCLERMRIARMQARKMLDVQRDARTEYAAFSPLSKLSATRYDFESAVQHATFDRKADLRKSYHKVFALKTQLWRIRTARGYQRDPQQPGNLPIAVSLLIAAVVGETLVNGILFAGGSEMGYLGGLTQALFISLVNLILSFGTGYLLKNKNSLKGWKKHTYLGGLLGFQQSVIGLVNLSAAHYRSAVAVLESFEQANRQFLNNVFAHPLQIETFESFVLLVFGIIIAQYMLYKGYSFGDTDREYGKVGKELAEAEANYADLKLNVEQDVKMARIDADAAIDNIVIQFGRTISYFESSLNMSRDLSDEYARIASEWENAHTVLLRQFRECLESAPRTTPYPRYWDTYPSFSESEKLIVIDTSRDEQLLHTMVSMQKEVSCTADALKKEVHARELEESRNLEKFFTSIEGQAVNASREEGSVFKGAGETSGGGNGDGSKEAHVVFHAGVAEAGAGGGADDAYVGGAVHEADTGDMYDNTKVA